MMQQHWLKIHAANNIKFGGFVFKYGFFFG
jgi:hypothetical protein